MSPVGLPVITADAAATGRFEPRSVVVDVERDRLVRCAKALSWVSLAWMTVEGTVAITAALTAGSVALLGFGLDSVIEALASVIVIWRFTGDRGLSDLAERRAQRLVAISFFLLAPYVAQDAIRALIAGDHPSISLVRDWPVDLEPDPDAAPEPRQAARRRRARVRCDRGRGDPEPALRLPRGWCARGSDRQRGVRVVVGRSRNRGWDRWDRGQGRA
jgi:hypothetical protein